MQQAITLHLGSLSMVNRSSEVGLTPDDWGRIDTATTWYAAGLRDYGRQLLREIEDGHGVTAQDRRYAKLTDLGHIIVPPKATATIRTGGPALFVDDGKSERVIVTSDTWEHPDSGEAMRTCSFLDLAGGQYDVKAVNLAPCDDLFRALPLAPAALETGKWAGVPRDAEPYRTRTVSKAPVMDKFDRVAPVKPEDVRLDLARMTPGQRERLRVAEAKLASAERRKDFRRRIVAGRVTGYGRMTNEEKNERADYRAEMDRLQLETIAANDRAEVSRGRVETLALEERRARMDRRRQLANLLSVMKVGLVRRPDIVTALIAERKRLRTEGRKQVEVDSTGRIRLTCRDGLESLPLNDIQKAAALWYRELFERTQRGARVASWGDRPMGEMKDRKASDWGLDQITRKAVEAKVMVECRNGRGLTALRLVAGEGRTINAISGGKSQNRKLNTEALIVALDVVADHRGMQ